ncbi:hypothetical protein JANAI62_24900 [Jannaschia pagri]|uniref:Uncharacterized protein n=1 Tax=Jannaschia pagri TaxID=2829797 RepID=A0ABQ4NN80_9RHOB|nr:MULTISPECIES: hypothetical protein [unclassified Jannaschia]GIT92033.1 hypothetical protein JANAI61_24910 [Jannaschia sp. AI_61]GIT95867.1 hypothetical protein JANAI62_24900 [Jannaschia sp. AI_62]
MKVGTTLAILISALVLLASLWITQPDQSGRAAPLVIDDQPSTFEADIGEVLHDDRTVTVPDVEIENDGEAAQTPAPATALR